MEFCEWLAEYFDTPTPVSNSIVATDEDAGIRLRRWNHSFARVLCNIDPDVVDGLFGGDSPIDQVTCFPTWMTQRQAWRMAWFSESKMQGGSIVVELRHL